MLTDEIFEDETFSAIITYQFAFREPVIFSQVSTDFFQWFHV